MGYKFPPISLLEKTDYNLKYTEIQLQNMADRILQVLELYDIKIRGISANITPLSVCFELKPDTSTNVKNFRKIKADLELRLAANTEIFDQSEGKGTITVVVMPKDRPFIGLRNLIESKEFQNAESPLTVCTGVDYVGNKVLADIESLPHMLIAGTTGAGKTVFLDDLIVSLLYKATPEDVRLFMVDPKKVDLTYYSGIPHLLTDVIYENKEVMRLFKWVESEMMERYSMFAQVNCRNLKSYIEKTGEKIPQIVVIIDEYAELMNDYKKDVEDIIERIGRLGRAAGIHLIIATQRPSNDIVTGSIKINLPCRASFTVVDGRESNAIINKAGAQKLLGSGDMLFSLSANGVVHAQAPYVSEKEIKAIVSYVIKNNPQYRH